MINQNIPHFRKETKGGVLIDYSLIPYNEENYSTYKKYQNLFQNKSLKNLSKDEVLYIINNSNTTDIIIPRTVNQKNIF